MTAMIDKAELIEDLELIQFAAEVALMDVQMNAQQMAKAIMVLAEQAIRRLKDENRPQQEARA